MPIPVFPCETGIFQDDELVETTGEMNGILDQSNVTTWTDTDGIQYTGRQDMPIPVFPFTIVEASTAFKTISSQSILHSVLPFTFIAVPVCIIHDSLTIRLTVFQFPQIKRSTYRWDSVHRQAGKRRPGGTGHLYLY